MKYQMIALSVSLLAGASACRNARSTCEEALQIQCEFRFRCCEDDEIHAGGAMPYVTSEGECVDRIKDICAAFSAPIDESIAAGRTEFDAELAQKCIDQAKEARDKCDPDFEYDDECSSGGGYFFGEGLVKDGDKCAADYECADEGDCVIEYDEEYVPEDVDEETGSLEGECKALPGEGDDCPDGSCQSGLYCDFMDNTCKELKGNGDACDGSYECESGNCDFDSGECAAEEEPEEEESKICNGRK